MPVSRVHDGGTCVLTDLNRTHLHSFPLQIHPNLCSYPKACRVSAGKFPSFLPSFLGLGCWVKGGQHGFFFAVFCFFPLGRKGKQALKHGRIDMGHWYQAFLLAPCLVLMGDCESPSSFPPSSSSLPRNRTSLFSSNSGFNPGNAPFLKPPAVDYCSPASPVLPSHLGCRQ